MLAEATTIQAAKELKDLAITAADWARRKGLGQEAVQYARSYALDAERKMGEMLLETERADGGDAQRTRLHHVTESPPTLADLGITKRESSQAQKLAALPQEKFEQIKTGEKARRAIEREVKREELEEIIPEKPSGKYRVIYADPPWKYGDQLTENYGPTRFHYPSMSIADLCALPVNDLAENNAVLFLWVTSPMLSECWPVIRAWGFTYKASFVWDKVKHNMGHYNSVRHEFLLICTGGSCLPDTPELIDSVQTIERQEHSKKPEEFRKLIDKLYINGSRIELFGRGDKPEGWDIWGNETT